MTSWNLRPHPRIERRGPLLVCVLDGVGVGSGDDFDAWAQAKTPVLDKLVGARARACTLRAHGRAVGLPSDGDMGNSEVGHNALGCGRIVTQGAALVDTALKGGALFEGAGWAHVQEAISAGGTLHLIGLLSDGGVHSRLDQLFALLDGAAARGARHIRMHVLTDGRDVPDGTSVGFVEQLEAKLATLRTGGVDAQIASGGGRMTVTMDRYEADWSVVERGWRAHVLADAAQFSSAAEAIAKLSAENGGTSDQNLGPFVVTGDDGTPCGPIVDGDAVVVFNYRGDRVIEISRAFEDDDFTAFERERRPKVHYAGIMEYDGDSHIPQHYLVAPPSIEHTASELLVAEGVRTFAVSETHKFGHVTYFWNGNRAEAFDEKLERFEEIPSFMGFLDHPEMKAREIASSAAAALRSGKWDQVRVNIANGDMIGHTGDLDATVRACAVVDEALGAMLSATEDAGGSFLVVADHGNCDDMVQRDKAGGAKRDASGTPLPLTSHTLAAVPLCIGGPALDAGVSLRTDIEQPGLANVTATYLELLGFTAPEGYEPSLLKVSG